MLWHGAMYSPAPGARPCCPKRPFAACQKFFVTLRSWASQKPDLALRNLATRDHGACGPYFPDIMIAMLGHMGPRMMIQSEGIMNNTMGKVILSGASWASFSAFCRRFTRIS